MAYGKDRFTKGIRHEAICFKGHPGGETHHLQPRHPGGDLELSWGWLGPLVRTALGEQGPLQKVVSEHALLWSAAEGRNLTEIRHFDIWGLLFF